MFQHREDSINTTPRLDQIDIEALRVALHDGIHGFKAVLNNEDWTDETVCSTLYGLYTLSLTIVALEASRRDKVKAEAA